MFSLMIKVRATFIETKQTCGKGSQSHNRTKGARKRERVRTCAAAAGSGCICTGSWCRPAGHNMLPQAAGTRSTASLAHMRHWPPAAPGLCMTLAHSCLRRASLRHLRCRTAHMWECSLMHASIRPLQRNESTVVDFDSRSILWDCCANIFVPQIYTLHWTHGCGYPASHPYFLKVLAL